VDKVNATLIRYPRFNQLHRNIQLCQSISKIAGEPQCLILEGVPGVGKSTLVKSYVEACPRYETPSGTKVPIFYLETKGMAAKLLDVLGDPAANHGTLWSMNARLIHFIQACEVQMVILDDFHHLIDQETNRVLHKVSDWLKVLIKETNVPFLVVGIVNTVRRILDANAQLSRLFALRETLHPFRWDPQKPDTIKEFAAFVAFAESKIGMALTLEIEHQDLLYRLYEATDGIVGNLMNLLRYSVAIAHQKGDDRLTRDTLTTAFQMRLAEHVRKRNPFTLSANEPLSGGSAVGTETTGPPDQLAPATDGGTTK
jgi:hypothetical protein